MRESASYLFGSIFSAAFVFGSIKTLVLFALELFLALDISVDVRHDVEPGFQPFLLSVLIRGSLDEQ